MRLFLAFVLALLSMSSTTAQARPVEGVPCARAGAWHARGELQGHNGGLLYAQQRWLDPSTGRFLSLDPYAGELQVPMSTQGFTYLQANPTSGVDPDGRCGPGGAAVGAVLGAAFGGIGAAYQNWGQSGHGFTKALMKGIFLGAAGGAATGLTCGVGAALGIGTSVGAATSGITAMETAESWGEVAAAAGKGAAVGLVAGVAGAAVSSVAGAGASALTNSAGAATRVVAQTAAEFGSGTVTSAAVQYATSEDGTIDWGQALIDGGAAAAGYGASRIGPRQPGVAGGLSDLPGGKSSFNDLSLDPRQMGCQRCARAVLEHLDTPGAQPGDYLASSYAPTPSHKIRAVAKGIVDDVGYRVAGESVSHLPENGLYLIFTGKSAGKSSVPGHMREAGHVLLAEKTPDGTTFYDPQRSSKSNPSAFQQDVSGFNYEDYSGYTAVKVVPK